MDAISRFKHVLAAAQRAWEIAAVVGARNCRPLTDGPAIYLPPSVRLTGLVSDALSGLSEVRSSESGGLCFRYAA